MIAARIRHRQTGNDKIPNPSELKRDSRLRSGLIALPRISGNVPVPVPAGYPDISDIVPADQEGILLLKFSVRRGDVRKAVGGDAHIGYQPERTVKDILSRRDIKLSFARLKRPLIKKAQIRRILPASGIFRDIFHSGISQSAK